MPQNHRYLNDFSQLVFPNFIEGTLVIDPQSFDNIHDCKVPTAGSTGTGSQYK